MTRILLLGGTGDALSIARHLGPRHIYSLAGLSRVPTDLACTVRAGGFGGAKGLARFIESERIDLLIDVTHPYAAQISANAIAASRASGIACWAARRPAWQARAGDDWREFADWASLVTSLERFSRPLFTLGREPLAHLDQIPASQYWIVRCLEAHRGSARARVLDARGPFTAEGERGLFLAHAIDVLVSKNSGGRATEAKLDIARKLGLPVLMLRRPALPAVDREFHSADALLNAVQTICR